MADVASELQAAIYAVLTGGAFQAAIGASVPVYDRVPGEAKPPYIKIGDDDVLADLASGYDGRETHVTIAVWTPGPGKALLKKIAGAVQDYLSPAQPADAAPFLLPSHVLVTWSFEGARFSADVDGVSEKGVVTISYQTHPSAT